MDNSVPASTLAAIDLFCGCGGLTLGFKMAGFKVMVGLDVDRDAVSTYRRNNPKVVVINKDVRKTSSKEILDEGGIDPGDVDVLMAGIPCEGYSLLNRYYDPDDPRNYLFQEFMRIAKKIDARCVLIENVPGLARRANGTFKEAITQDLRDMGYNLAFAKLNAADYGVPQLRERIFFLAMKETPPSFPPPSHGPTKQLRLSEESEIQPHVSVWDAISDLPELGPGEFRDEYDKQFKTNYQRMLRGDNSRLFNHEAPRHPPWTVKVLENVREGAPIYRTFKQRVRLSWKDPAPTIPAGGIRPQWFFAHPEQPRGLTVRECARLQSFPDNYVFVGPLIKQRIQVGDSVPPVFAKALAEWIEKCLS